MLFSVIVPIYGVEEYLTPCVESILAQSWTDFELLLVDDGSPDACPAMCDAFALRDARVRVLHLQNGGVARARQSGVELASGRYLVFVDGDDFLPSDCLERFARSIASSEADCICGGFSATDGENCRPIPPPCPAGYYSRARMEKELFPFLIEDSDGRYFSNSVCARAWKKDLFKGFPLTESDISVGEDGACAKVALFHARSLLVLVEPLYFYRKRGSSITRSGAAFHWEGPAIISRHYEKHIDLDAFDLREQVRRNIVHNVFNVAASRFGQNKGWRDICREIVRETDRPFYREAIEHCRFKPFSKGWLAAATLKYRVVFLIWLYSILKRCRR